METFPTNPQDEPLPELNDAVLDADGLAALFRDYQACATRIEVVLRDRPGVAPVHNPSLEAVLELLRSGGVRGAQIRYQYEGATWCDTLMPGAGGVRLVRIKRPSAE